MNADPLMMGLLVYAMTSDTRPRKDAAAAKPVKTCLECGDEHQHNNSWCSAQCCKLWKAKKKYQRRGQKAQPIF